MFESHFGLRENPFVAGHHARFVYPSPEHQEALAHLRFGIENREPFVLITGEVGTGKTTALYDALEQMRSSVTVALINNSALTRSELLEEIALRFGVALSPPVTKPQVTLHLERHLLGLKARGERAILLLDEAQNFERDLLEEIRLLSNLEAGGEKLVQIVLIGQPELEERLGRPELRQLRQRIAIHYRLHPLGAEDTTRYIHHRITVAGGYAPALFPADTCAEVYRITHGIPREINQVCAQAMLNGYVEDSRQVRPEHVRAIEQEGEFRSVLDGGAADEAPEPPATLGAIPPMRAVPRPTPAPTAAPPPAFTPPVPLPPRIESVPPRAEPPVAEPKHPEFTGPPQPSVIPASKLADESTWEAWVAALVERHGIPDPTAEHPAPMREPDAPEPQREPPRPEPPRIEPPRPEPPQIEPPRPEPPPPPVEPDIKPVTPPHREEVAAAPRVAPPPPIEFPKRPVTVVESPKATPPREPAAEDTGTQSDWRPPAWKPYMSSRRLEEEERAAAGGGRSPLLAILIGVLVVATIVVGWVLYQRFGRNAATAGEGTSATADSARVDSLAAATTSTNVPTAPPEQTVAPTTPAEEPSPPAASRVEPQPASPPPAAVSRPARPSAPAPATAAAASYAISVGAFLDAERAETERDRLAGTTQLGGSVRSVRQDGSEMYQVLLGRFDTRADAERAAGDLIQRGLVDEARVVRASR